MSSETPESSAPFHISMEGISKTYPEGGVAANRRVTFRVRRGEIHGLIGENGAGKSTLMKILYGLERADAGTIRVHGVPRQITSPLEANRLGIGMVQQHFQLFPPFTVAQNVVMGAEPRRGRLFFDHRRAERETRELMTRHGFSLDPRTPVSRLSVGGMQQVEILKMLYRRVELLILDEPTAVLTEQETRGLFATLRRLAAQGQTVILITHKLKQVLALSDRITVMRKGGKVAVRETAHVDKAELSRLMVGRRLLFHIEKKPPEWGAPVLDLEDVSLFRRGQERPLLDRVSLTVRSGQIMGVTAVAGNGLKELEEVLSGLRRGSAGKIRYHGEDITAWSVAQRRAHGLAYVPSDRMGRGACLESSVKENLMVTQHSRFRRRGVFFDHPRIEAYAREMIEHYRADAAPDSLVGRLSGGNIQKMILARELSRVTDFALFAEPSWGLDVASSQFIYEKILELQARGTAVVILSSDLDEILGLADVVVVLFHGRKTASFTREAGLDKDEIGEYMLGIRGAAYDGV